MHPFFTLSQAIVYFHKCWLLFSLLFLAILCGSCETDLQEIDHEQNKIIIPSDEISFEVDSEHELLVFPTVFH